MLDIQELKTFIEGNQILASAVGIYGMGAVTYLVRDIPNKAYRFLKRQLTTSITITSQNKSYSNAIKWFRNTFKNKNYRTIKLNNGRWGYSDDTIKSLGYGSHYTIYNGVLLHIELEKDENNKTEYDKDILVITTFKRSHDTIDKLIKEFDETKKEAGKVEVYKFEDGWNFAKHQNERPMNTVYIEDSKKDLLKKSLDNFINSESWYNKHGIPYQLGIMLHGEAGTGKSSIIKAIATYLDYPIYYVDPNDLSKLEQAIASLPANSLLVIEDIDSSPATHSRESDNEDMTSLVKKQLSGANLSSILNCIDGMFSSHGRIMVTTTNHIEKLDSALIRAGRIDLKLEINFADKSSIKQFFNNFFPENKLNFEVEFKDKIKISDLQNKVLLGMDCDEIFNSIKK